MGGANPQARINGMDQCLVATGWVAIVYWHGWGPTVCWLVLSRRRVYIAQWSPVTDDTPFGLSVNMPTGQHREATLTSLVPLCNQHLCVAPWQSSWLVAFWLSSCMLHSSLGPRLLRVAHRGFPCTHAGRYLVCT